MPISRRMDKEAVVHIHNGILLSHKEEQNSAICGNMMDLEDIMLSEISQTEKDKYYIISHIHGISKIQKTNECIRKEASSQIQKK